MSHLLPSSTNFEGFFPASAEGFVGFMGFFAAAPAGERYPSV